ncbi:hypothetical protein NA57DRAFT_51337 [Rhizodiscina lignyota]|uniref:Uncharacterized protein n=1 Tax=Rhizodiscina lignyota TaxID=1504668 RepID=A0A9P4MBC4_9PEZI|nr:hypothetical protein NA57DRAFT_51337 [Rhizodiscina lignyota]
MADKFKSIAKGGWRPGKEKDPYDYGPSTTNSTHSRTGLGIRRNIKGVETVAKWTGHSSSKGGGQSDYDADNHQSTPLGALKDPSSFGPPPRRTGTADSFGSGVSSSRASPASPGAPLSHDHTQPRYARKEQEQREEEEEEEQPPPMPYRPDTTGLSTAGLPPPPRFRGDGAAHSPAPAPAPAARPVPSLPPRLPTRSIATPPPSYNEAAAEPERGVLNQGALNRLGQAGVSVPGFGIGGNQGATRPVPGLAARNPVSPPLASPPAHAEAPASPSGLGHGGQLNELQARFARMGSNSSNAATASSPTSPSFPSSPIKKKPPPPPPKKRELHSQEAAPAAPPIPVSSKPR